MAQYRNEWKFYCTDYDMAILEARIRHIMQRDIHQTDNAYQIRSVYFDDYENHCYYENLGGLSRRKKFRIRTYNHKADTIRLEIKYKINNMTRKDGCLITKETCADLLSGRPLPIEPSDSLPLKRLKTEIQTNGMHPVEIVEYERTAYVYPVGNVRVTFDRNISASSQFSDFLSERVPLIPCMPPGIHLVEIKFDEFLPDFLKVLLETGRLTQVAFSKYVLCREHLQKPGRREILWESMN